MTKAAQQRGSVTGGAVDTTGGLLSLGAGSEIKPVYVWSDGEQVGFSSTAEGPFYTGGMEWQFRTDDVNQYSLFLSFVFLGEADRIVSEKFALSEPDAAHIQLGCVRPVADTFDFNVEVGRNRRILIDPKMVVTPL